MSPFPICQLQVPESWNSNLYMVDTVFMYSIINLKYAYAYILTSIYSGVEKVLGETGV